MYVRADLKLLVNGWFQGNTEAPFPSGLPAEPRQPWGIFCGGERGNLLEISSVAIFFLQSLPCPPNSGRFWVGPLTG